MGYLGAKNAAGVFQAIIALQPPHDTYIEAFAGSGAILKRKAPAARSIALDLNSEMADQLRQLAGVEVRCECALAFLEGLDLAQLGRVLIYCDPPYVLATRTSEKRYRYEFTDDDHRRLAAALQRLSAAGALVILSGYPSALYDELFAGWRILEFQAMTRGGVRTEKLWFNFEPGAAHWATFAGRDHTERQRIKRKAAIWARDLMANPPAERQALLAAMLSALAADSTVDAGDCARSGRTSAQSPPSTVADVDASVYARGRRPQSSASTPARGTRLEAGPRA